MRENVIGICVTIVVLAMIGFLGYTVYSSRTSGTERMTACVSAGGEYVQNPGGAYECERRE